MNQVQVAFLLEVSDDATNEQIALMVSNAAVQLEEPSDEDGKDATFTTSNLQSDWFVVGYRKPQPAKRHQTCPDCRRTQGWDGHFAEPCGRKVR